MCASIPPGIPEPATKPHSRYANQSHQVPKNPAIGAHWPFLSDAGRVVQKDLDIAEYTDPINNPMIPHVLVLEPGLIVHTIYNGYWFFGRPTMEDLRQDLRAVTRKCRPDWDITTPEMKAAWKEGRKELFYPYGKSYTQTLGEQD
jgi:hypothetical protein